MSDTLKLDISGPSKEFEDFLNLEGNERIIFSGIFGSGKTYFLRSFFDSNPKYVPIFVNPINYSVAQNGDIFELIKYDLLYQIIVHRPYLEKLDPSNLETIPFLKFTDTMKALEPFVRNIPKIGKYLTEVAESISFLKDLLDKKKEKIKTNEGEQIAHFIQRFHHQEGNIYEYDLYSHLIRDLLRRLKGDGRQTVMIVDDLDRIDPAHIFRIMNVFAAHFRIDTLEEEENKFGIDKIILCCDVENVRAIFRSKYGINVDFNGYIDKFYSRSVFNFNNRRAVVQAITKILASIKIDPKQRDFILPLTPDNWYFDFSVVLIASLVLSEKLNLRTLKRIFGREYRTPIYSIHFEGQRIANWQLPILTLFDFIHSVFGTVDATMSALDGFVFIPTDQENLGLFDRSLSESALLDLCAELVAICENGRNGLKPDTNFRNDIEGLQFQYYLKSINLQSIFDPRLIGRFGTIESDGPITRPQIALDLFKKKLIEAFQVWANAKRSTVQRA